MAYDKFGPTIGQWKGMVIARDYILQGAQSSIGFYIGTGGIMAVLTILHRAQFGQYVGERSMIEHRAELTMVVALCCLFATRRSRGLDGPTS